MSRINRGENIWRLHDHVNNPDGSRWLFFRNAVEPNDWMVHSNVFAGSHLSALKIRARHDA